MILLAQIVVTWGQLGLFLGVPTALLALIKFGDRLWGKRNGNGRQTLTERVAKLEVHVEEVGEKLTSIDSRLETLNDRLFEFLTTKR